MQAFEQEESEHAADTIMVVQQEEERC